MDLGRSLIITGELSASQDLTLTGQMTGTITVLDHTLTIGPHANIHATITAKAVVVLGAVIGNITADDRVDIRATGSVVGDISSPHLVMADGGQLAGQVEMPRSVA
jgi:cytoskeletal protein CcmA (bactofilin family)